MNNIISSTLRCAPSAPVTAHGACGKTGRRQYLPYLSRLFSVRISGTILSSEQYFCGQCDLVLTMCFSVDSRYSTSGNLSRQIGARKTLRGVLLERTGSACTARGSKDSLARELLDELSMKTFLRVTTELVEDPGASNFVSNARTEALHLEF